MLSTKYPMHREVKQVTPSHTACKCPDLGKNSSSSSVLHVSSTPFYLRLSGSAARESPRVKPADSTEPLLPSLPKSASASRIIRQMVKKGMRWI